MQKLDPIAQGMRLCDMGYSMGTRPFLSMCDGAHGFKTRIFSLHLLH